MEVIDGREMVPPEPFERVMEAISVMPSGGRIMLILNREPLPLYRVLKLNGLTYHTTSFPDGRFEVIIEHETGEGAQV